MRLMPVLSGLTAMLVLAGCASLNPFSSKVPPRNPPAALVDFKPAAQLRTVWSSNIGSSANYGLTPATARGDVFVASATGNIARINVANGSQVWRINASTSITAGVGTDGLTVAVGGADGMVLAFGHDGQLLWKAQASSEVLSAPAVGEGVVVVRSLDNRITAYDALTGSQRWTLQRPAPSLSLRAAPGIIIAHSTAFVGMPGGRLLALDLANGAPRWEVSVGDPRGATELERVADVSGFPLLIGSTICATSYQGRVGCVEAASGTGGWSKPLSSAVGVGGDEQLIFTADDHDIVNAFTRDSGVSVWRNDKLKNRGLTAPIVFGQGVAVGDKQGFLHLLSREDGAFVTRAETGKSAILGRPAVVGTTLVVQTQAGAVIALTIGQ